MSVTRGYGLLEGFLAAWRCRKADTLLKDLPQRKCILDIGCGTYPLFLSKARFIQKYGLDKVTSDDIRDGFGRNINLVNYDIEKEAALPFADNHFDAVTMLAVMEHIEPQKLPVLFKEIRRVLAPGGIYVITVPAAWSDGVLKVMAWLKLVSSVEIDEHKSAMTQPQIVELLRGSGFPDDGLRYGYFELFMNTWYSARK